MYVSMQNSGKETKEFRQAWLNRYRNTLGFLDHALADLLKNVDLNDNIVIVTGDHGESFYEDGTWLHSSRQSDIQTQVPMIIAGRGIPPGEVRERTSHLDMAPTLLHALGATAHSPPQWHGRNLLFGEIPARLKREDSLILVNFSLDHLTFLFNNQRLHLALSKDRTHLYSLGFEDPNGRFLPLNQKLSEPPNLWVNAIRHQLEKVTN